MNEIVKNAILNTPVDYLAKVLEQRNPGPKSLGSFFAEEQTPQSLMEADWRPYHHPAILDGVQGFLADIPGYLGLVHIDMVDFWDIPLFLAPSRKGTGFMEVTCTRDRNSVSDLESLRRSFSVALVGPGENGSDILWTVFPGDPIQPSAMECPVDFLEPLEIDANKARELGFEWAKVEWR